MPRRWTVAVTTLAAVALTACGSSQPFPGGSASGARVEVAAPVVFSSLRTTNAEHSARMSMRMEMTGLPTDDAFLVTGDGAMTLDGKKMDFTAKTRAAGHTITMSMRGIDGVFYMRMSGVPNAPDKWMKLDARDLGSTGTFGSTSDPGQFLDYLYGIADKIEEVGHENVRGADTTHYYAVIDLQRAVENEATPPDTHKRLRDEVAQMGIAVPPMPADIWIDDEGRLRKLQLIMDFSSMFGGPKVDGMPGITTTATIELYDFGVAVDVEHPPASEVIPLDRALLGSGMSA